MVPRGHGRKRKMVKKDESMVYIPILKTLQSLLQDEEILGEVCSNVNGSLL